MDRAALAPDRGEVLAGGVADLAAIVDRREDQRAQRLEVRETGAEGGEQRRFLLEPGEGAPQPRSGARESGHLE